MTTSTWQRIYRRHTKRIIIIIIIIIIITR